MYVVQREGACVRESHSALCSVLRRTPSLHGYIGSHRLPPGLGLLKRRREVVTERGLRTHKQRGMCSGAIMPSCKAHRAPRLLLLCPSLQ